MSKKISNQIYINRNEIEDKGLEKVLIASIGRKRSGVIRMLCYNDRDELNSNGSVHNLLTFISYKFKREMVSLDHQIEDRPTAVELLHGDLPWVGLVRLCDEDNDAKYRVVGFIRSMVIVDRIVFHIRDTRDGSPYSEGLTIMKLGTSPLDNSVKVETTTGLKQTTVVEMFQGYNQCLDSLKSYMIDLGYQQCPTNKMHMLLHHNNTVVSDVEIALVGVVD